VAEVDTATNVLNCRVAYSIHRFGGYFAGARFTLAFGAVGVEVIAPPGVAVWTVPAGEWDQLIPGQAERLPVAWRDSKKRPVTPGDEPCAGVSGFVGPPVTEGMWWRTVSAPCRFWATTWPFTRRRVVLLHRSQQTVRATAPAEGETGDFPNGAVLYAEDEPVPLPPREDFTGLDFFLKEASHPEHGEVYFTFNAWEARDVSDVHIRFREREGSRYRVELTALVYRVFEQPSELRYSGWIQVVRHGDEPCDPPAGSGG
jgi:hypothetical protein